MGRRLEGEAGKTWRPARTGDGVPRPHQGTRPPHAPGATMGEGGSELWMRGVWQMGRRLEGEAGK